MTAKHLSHVLENATLNQDRKSDIVYIVHNNMTRSDSKDKQ